MNSLGRNQGTRNPNYRHGHKVSGETPIYRAWRKMLDRCLRASEQNYKYYGGRGIKVCKRWRVFSNFLADMGRSWKRGLTLERKNGNRNYTPRNCTWVTWKDQQNNKVNNRVISFRGKTMTLTQWAEYLGIPERRLSSRINSYKWTVEQSLTTDKMKNQFV